MNLPQHDWKSGWHRTLSGRVIVITGAASGIGRGTALMAARDGATIVGLDRDGALLGRLAEDAGEWGSKIRTRVADITDAKSVEDAARWCKDEIGSLNGLVCSAGTTQETPFLDFPLELWHRILDVNLTGTFLICQALSRQMVAASSSGSIVTVSSSLALAARKGGAAYSSSKAAVLALTKTMALELAAHGIRVNNVAPGSVDTPLARRTHAASGRTGPNSKQPLGRVGRPEDLAAMICFLLSDSASWITGQTMHVNGGSLLV